MKIVCSLLLLWLLSFTLPASAQVISVATPAERTDTTVTVFDDPVYQLTLQLFDVDNDDEDKGNATLTLKHINDRDTSTLFVDSLFCKQLRLQLQDFNGDGVKDVLVFHTSSARSNWSHYLYLVDKTHDRLIPVKGFMRLLNPEVDPKTGVITSAALYGDKVFYSFYKIGRKGTLLKAGRSYEGKTE